MPRPVTGRMLLRMMEDERYRDPFHPEHTSYLLHLRRAFREVPLGSLEDDGDGRDTGGGRVHVRAHTQVRDGETVEVSEHERGAPPRSAGARIGPDLRRFEREWIGGDGETVEVSEHERGTPPRSEGAHVAPDLWRFEREWNGRYVAGSDECVILVQKAVPGIGHTTTWREGAKIRGIDDPPLAPGTAIATFDNGEYLSRNTGNHAAIFLEYGVSGGKSGMWVLDQYEGRPAGRRHIPFNPPSPSRRVNRAESYSVIAKKR